MKEENLCKELALKKEVKSAESVASLRGAVFLFVWLVFVFLFSLTIIPIVSFWGVCTLDYT